MKTLGKRSQRVLGITVKFVAHVTSAFAFIRSTTSTTSFARSPNMPATP